MSPLKKWRFKEARDVYSGTALVLFGAGYSSQIPNIKVAAELAVGGSKFLPTITGVGLIAVGLLITALALRKLSATAPAGATGTGKIDSKSPEEKRAGILGVVLTFAYFMVYSLILPKAGFLLSTFLYLFAMIHLLAPRGDKRPIRHIAIAAVCALAVYLVFTRAFDMVLPRGILAF